MSKHAIAAIAIFAVLAGCKGKSKAPADSVAPPSAAAQPASSAVDPPAQSSRPASQSSSVSLDPPQYQYSDPPIVSVGPSIDEAYAAIPHRRTIWDENGSTVPSEERPYLRVVFGALDQAVRIRVAGQQNYGSQQFDAADVDGEFDKLIAFVRALPAPKTLVAYRQDVLSALSSERQFFNEWKAQRDQFPFAQQVANHPGVRSASSNLRGAYNELMSHYPNESAANKDAFFDYHCALDFL
jgi:hypothetical protein